MKEPVLGALLLGPSCFARADVERAFQRGWSTKTDERMHGRGLGLALVARTVHRHGGSIQVSNEHGWLRQGDPPFHGCSVGIESS